MKLNLGRNSGTNNKALRKPKKNINTSTTSNTPNMMLFSSSTIRFRVYIHLVVPVTDISKFDGNGRLGCQYFLNLVAGDDQIFTALW